MPEKITSAHNPRIKNLLLLQSKSRERLRQNRIVIEGYREISRALKAGFIVRELYTSVELDISDHSAEILRQFPVTPFIVSAPIFEKLAYREGSDGLIALAEPKYLSLDELKIGETPLIIVLESVEKPGNLGAIMRTADAVGADAVIICDPLTDLFNPNTIRSSLGCIFTRQVAMAASADVMQWLKDKGIISYAAALTESAESYYLQDYTKPSAIIMGTESTGLSQQWLDFSTRQVIIPMNGIADSLNVSVSTAILVYEAMRQRLLTKGHGK
jgi:RNA methyltransferase, TrmH family